ncbi:MAG: LOG family protein [Candidatus Hydrogenedentes bacterium]|nr:LOG family protein [Candidatus Hydrogenedentota bacterium]
MRRLPIIGVMGSLQEDSAELAGPLGLLIARLGCHLLTGGRGGAMEAVSRAFCSVKDRRGYTLGILPEGSPPNPFVEIPIFTQLPATNDPSHPEWRWSRNHINIRTSNAVIALPGGAGTASELELATAGPHQRPCLAFLGARGRIARTQRLEDTAALLTEAGARVPIATDISQVEAFLQKYATVPRA